MFKTEFDVAAVSSLFSSLDDKVVCLYIFTIDYIIYQVTIGNDQGLILQYDLRNEDTYCAKNETSHRVFLCYFPFQSTQ